MNLGKLIKLKILDQRKNLTINLFSNQTFRPEPSIRFPFGAENARKASI